MTAITNTLTYPDIAAIIDAGRVESVVAVSEQPYGPILWLEYWAYDSDIGVGDLVLFGGEWRTVLEEDWQRYPIHTLYRLEGVDGWTTLLGKRSVRGMAWDETRPNLYDWRFCDGQS